VSQRNEWPTSKQCAMTWQAGGLNSRRTNWRRRGWQQTAARPNAFRACDAPCAASSMRRELIARSGRSADRLGPARRAQLVLKPLRSVTLAVGWLMVVGAANKKKSQLASIDPQLVESTASSVRLHAIVCPLRVPRYVCRGVVSGRSGPRLNARNRRRRTAVQKSGWRADGSCGAPLSGASF
jgi:hypothetical protein